MSTVLSRNVMKKNFFITLFFLVLIVTGSAYAHDAKLHRGKPLEGIATVVTASSITVKGESTETIVTLIPETKYEAGMEGAPAIKSDLKVGSTVMVYSTKLESGDLVAKEIILHSAFEPNGHKHQDSHSASH